MDDDEKVSLTNPNNVCGGQKAWFLTEDEGEKIRMFTNLTISKVGSNTWFLTENVLDVIKRRKEKEKNAISRHNKQI